jgi:hypothetical protein
MREVEHRSRIDDLLVDARADPGSRPLSSPPRWPPAPSS